MTARIFRPAKNAMQSGTAITKQWRLEYEPEQPQVIEPLMGWTSSGDMKREVTLHFETKEEAVDYCERGAIPYQVIDRRSRSAGQPPMPIISHFGASNPGPTKGAKSCKAIPALAGSKVEGCLG